MSNIELSTEKTLNSNNRIVISKKLLDGKNTVLNAPLLHGY
jgi:hemin uptake protein HemP